MSQLFKVQGGAELPVEQLSDADLEWYATKCKAAAKRTAAQAEVDRRKAGGKPQTMALAKAPTQAVLGPAMGDPAAVTQKLAELSGQYHLVAPQTQVDSIPEGCGVCVSLVLVSKDPRTQETYSVGGRLGLGRTALTKIAAAAGVDWDPRQSGRLDDGSDPHYCHFRAVGRVRQFDGTWRTITGEVEMDARDGSPQVDEIVQKARNPRSGKPRDPAPQILELRKFLLRHAESKAKNRAIADMGVRRSYDPAELDKPFAVAKLTWTGRSDDPEVKREFARATAANMLSGSSALYGEQASPAEPLAVAEFEGHEPPPVGETASADPDAGGHDIDAEGEDIPPAQTGTDDGKY